MKNPKVTRAKSNDKRFFQKTKNPVFIKMQPPILSKDNMRLKARLQHTITWHFSDCLYHTKICRT